MKKFAVYTFLYCFGIFLLNLFYSESYGNFYFLLFTLVGLIYNVLIIFDTHVLNEKYKFLSAGFIGVLTSFLVFNGGIIVLLYIDSDTFSFISVNGFGQYLNNAMLFKFVTVAAVGNIALWLGYISKLGDYLFSFYYTGLGYRKLLHLEISSTFPKFLIAIGLFLNLVLFVHGAYGRADADPSQFPAYVKYLIVFSAYIEKIALVGYFILMLIFFKTGKNKIWVWTTAILLVVFALVSGARGPIIFLFLLTVIPYYYVNRKITKQIILGGFVTFVIAFTVASEIKVFTKTLSNNVSIADYADAYLNFRDQSSADINRKIYASVYYNIMRRLNTVAQGSIAVKYKDDHGVDGTDPQFLKELLTVPLYVVIPRSSLGGEFPAWGQWFRLKVLKQNNDTYINNITFGAVGYYYLVAKWGFVAFGFFFYGIILRFSNNFILIGTNISFLNYLAILSAIGYVSASIPNAYVTFIRFVFFLPFIFYVVIWTSNKLRL